MLGKFASKFWIFFDFFDRLRDVVAEEKKLNLIFDYHDQDLKRYLESLKEDEYLESQKVKVSSTNNFLDFKVKISDF